jgi:hypothetical protein
MNEACRKFAEAMSSGDPERQADFLRQHLQECPDCRLECEVDRGLRHALDGLRLPVLSPGFARAVDARLKTEVQSRMALQRRLRWLRLYWLAAAGMSVLIFLNWQVSDLAPDAAWVAVGLLALLLVPVAWLLGGLQGELAGFVLGATGRSGSGEADPRRE